MNKEENMSEKELKMYNENYVNYLKHQLEISKQKYLNAVADYEETKHQLEVSEQKRLKAIEYINKYSDKGYNFGWVLQDGELDKLLEILGESND